MLHQGLYSSVAERQSCKLKVLGSIPSGGSILRACHEMAADFPLLTILAVAALEIGLPAQVL